MIDAAVYRDGEGPRQIDPSEISDCIDRPNSVVWVDVSAATDEDFECLAAEFALHPLAIEDARKHGQRAKLEQYPTHAFVVGYAATLAEVDLFIGSDWVVTVRGTAEDGTAWDVSGARRRFERTRPHGTSVGFLVYTILDDLVDGYFARIDADVDRVEAIEERIFTPPHRGRPDTWLQHDVFDARRDLLLFRRAIAPMREVVTSMMRGAIPWLDDPTLTHLQDVLDHVLRSLDQIDAQRELLANAVDAHLAMSSNRMNQVMKGMTSWGAILLGASLVAGIYGMNFEHMPELHWQYGYPMALGLMAIITVVGVWYFRRRDWL